MPNIADALKAEIARVARKEIRAEVEPLRKTAAQHRSTIAALRRQVDTLEKALRRTSKGQAPAPAQAEEGSTPRRFSASRLAAHRQKLGLSAAHYGQLVGVSGQTVYKWESGEVRPRASQLEAIASVRGIGPREAAQRLQAA